MQVLTKKREGTHTVKPPSCDQGPPRCRQSRGASRCNSGANHSILRKIESGQLRVSQANDKYELEADRIAEAVMHMPMSTVPVRLGNGPEREWAQRKCSECKHRPALGKPLNCEECQKVFQSKEVETNVTYNDSEHGAAARGAGSYARPLPDSVRAFFEPRFGVDFSPVRIHTDRTANESAKALNARAYTAGHDIFFAAGEFTPKSDRGQRLLAHELVHTIQQHAGSYGQLIVQRAPDGDCPSDVQVESNHAGECDEIDRQPDELQFFESQGPQLEGTARCTVIYNMSSGRADFGERKVKDYLQSAAQLAMSSESALIVITGYTDCITQAGPQLNASLRLQRAHRVATFMMSEFGIPAEKFRFDGAPITEYIAENSTPEGRAKNRAVAISIAKSGQAWTETSQENCAPQLQAAIQDVFRVVKRVFLSELVAIDTLLRLGGKKVSHIAMGIRPIAGSATNIIGFGGGVDWVIVQNFETGYLSAEECVFGEVLAGIPGGGINFGLVFGVRVDPVEHTGRERFCASVSDWAEVSSFEDVVSNLSVGGSVSIGLGVGLSGSATLISEGEGWLVLTETIGAGPLAGAELEGGVSVSASIQTMEITLCDVVDILRSLRSEVISGFDRFL